MFPKKYATQKQQLVPQRSETACAPQEPLASPTLKEAYTDFILSRQSMRCTQSTMDYYAHSAAKFVEFLETQITHPEDVSAKHVRAYLAALNERGCKDWTVNGHARAIRTLLNFWEAEKYIPDRIAFNMPKVEDRRMPVLSAEEVGKVVKACGTPREKAIILLMVDTGLRRSEVTALNWGDVDFSTGLARVIRGKGGKARSVVIGATVRRALLSYRRTLRGIVETSPLFQTKSGGRFEGSGMLQLFRRLSERSGVHISPHMLRRTFVILSLRSGMDVLHLQALLGHSTLEMVNHYAQLVDDDLLDAHRVYSPVDNLDRLK